MTDPTPERAALAVLDRMLDDLPVRPAPHLDAGAPAGRRRRPLVVAGSVAAVLALVAGLAAGLGLLGRPGTELDPVGPGGGVRPVGVGRVTVEVPTDWVVDDVRCGSDGSDVVYFGAQCQIGGASEALADSSSVLIEARRPPTTLRPGGAEDGLAVLESRVRCVPVSGRTCLQTFGVPALDAWFQVAVRADDGGRAQLDRIRASIAVLPDGQTTVPAPRPPALTREEYVRTLQAAGLAVEVVAQECPPTADCFGYGVEPAAGSVVEVGSTVTVTGY